MQDEQSVGLHGWGGRMPVANIRNTEERVRTDFTNHSNSTESGSMNTTIRDSLTHSSVPPAN